jgi:plastocyanin
VTTPAVVSALGAGALALLLAGAAVPAGETAGGRVTVRMTDGLQFVPARIEVRAGTTVVWRTTGSVSHTVTTIRAKATNKANARVPSGAKAWDSGFVGRGRSYSRRLTVPGTYRYFCIPHEGARMVGTVVVRR